MSRPTAIRDGLATLALAAGLLTAAARPAGAQPVSGPPPVSAVPAGRVAFVGGTVHPASGPAIPNGTVVVNAGRVESVSAGTAAPAGAEVVDCRGRHLYPGMITPLTILGLTEIATVTGSNDHQETGDTNPNVRAEVQFHPESDLIPVTRINGVTTAHVVPRGGALAGTTALMHLDGWTYEDMTVRAPVAMHLQWPNMTPARGWFETRSDEEQTRARDEAIRAIERSFDDARAYWKAQSAGGAVPRHDRDVKWDAMRKVLDGEIPLLISAEGLNQIRAALRFVDSQKLRRVVLASGHDAVLAADELKARNIPVIVSGTLETPRRRYEAYDAAFTAPEELRAAGVAFCIGDNGRTDAAANARNLPHNAAIAAAYGLPPDEALRAVTLYPARILGVDDRLGSIEPGKSADLVLANGDLLDMTTQVEQVWIAGRRISMESRQTRLFQKYDSRPRGPKARPR